MDIIVLLQQAVLNHASDIFVVAGLPVSYRANGRICREKEEKLMPPQTKECVEELYKLAFSVIKPFPFFSPHSICLLKS